MKQRLPILLAFLALSWGVAAQDVSVVKAGSQKTLVDWSTFRVAGDSGSQTFWRTLVDDLKRSGWFAEGRRGASELELSGAVSPSGSKLAVECRVMKAMGGRALLSKRYDQPANEAQRMAHFVADEIVEAVTGRKGVASTRVVMVGSRTGKKELYMSDANGANLRQITSDGSVSVAPKWGPQGRKLLYTSYLKRFPDVYLVDTQTGDRRRISKFPGLNTGGTLSPDGKEVALILSKDGNPELYIMNLKSGRLTRLTNTPRAAEASPTWSPDGDSIAYVSDQSGRPHIYRIGRRGGKGKRLTSLGSENVSPDWGPNGLLAFSARMGGQYLIGILDPKTRQAKQLMLDGADYEDPSWARDGRHIACTRTVNYRPKVYILDTLGDPPKALTTERGDWYSPAWSPQ